MSDEQLSLVPLPKKRVKAPVPLADVNPVATVLIDNSLPHLDRLFDYSVPAKLDAQAQPGVRVRVRFAGKLIDGFLIERKTASEHPGTLLPLNVISDEPVLSPSLYELVKSVALRNAGVTWDVVRAAIPNRHARAEATTFTSAPVVPDVASTLWAQYSGGAALIQRSVQQQTPRAVVPTGSDNPADLIAEYVGALAHHNLGSIVVVPDRTAITRVLHALKAVQVPQSAIAVLAADDGPEVRYRNWLSALRGQARIVVGTRSAVFGQVQHLSAICVWDDWNETLLEPHAPYWHPRDVAVQRSSQESLALVIVGCAPSTDAVALMPWLATVAKPTTQARSNMARVRSALEEPYDQGVSVRLPSLAFQTISQALKTGPVLVCVPRTGYSPRLVCDSCRTLAQCDQCHGPLIQTSRSSDPMCRMCGLLQSEWSCGQCTGKKLRATVIGAVRTAEELGRAFPGIPVRSSSADRIVREIDQRPSIVVATPGAAPLTPKGYRAAILLDGNAMLSRPDLRAAEDTFEKWMECTSLVHPDGEVVVVADAHHPAVQALIRHDPIGFAQREIADRASVDLPPAQRLAVLTGAQSDVEEFLAIVELPTGVLVRGPVPIDNGIRMLLSIDRSHGNELATALKTASSVRSTRKKGDVVNVRFDPYDL